MHPHTFINELWNGNEEDEVFVAMSFHESYSERFENILKPAIEAIKVNGKKLSANRVDERK